MRINNDRILNAQSMAASIVGPSVDLEHIGMAAIHCIWTGASPTGDIVVQVSVNGADWVNLGAAFVQAITVAGERLFLLTDIGYPRARVVFNRASGTGTLNAWINAKGF